MVLNPLKRFVSISILSLIAGKGMCRYWPKSSLRSYRDPPCQGVSIPYNALLYHTKLNPIRIHAKPRHNI